MLHDGSAAGLGALVEEAPPLASGRTCEIQASHLEVSQKCLLKGVSRILRRTLSVEIFIW